MSLEKKGTQTFREKEERMHTLTREKRGEYSLARKIRCLFIFLKKVRLPPIDIFYEILLSTVKAEGVQKSRFCYYEVINDMIIFAIGQKDLFSNQELPISP